MITAHVFIAISLDGFIARPDGDTEWLLQRDDPAEDHGHQVFIADKEMIVMGRATYEMALTFSMWLHDRPVLVLFRQLAGTAAPKALVDQVRFSSLAPRALIEQLAKQGVHSVGRIQWTAKKLNFSWEPWKPI